MLKFRVTCQTQNYLRIVQRYLRMVENFAMLPYTLLKLLPGSTVRWRGRRYLIVDYQSLGAIIARQPGKRRLERIPVNEAATGSRFPYRFRRDTGPCVGTGEGLANSGKEIRDAKAAPQHGELRTNLRSCQKGGSCFG